MEIPEHREQILSPEEIEKIDAEIKELIASLDNYDFASFDDDVREEWISTEQEALAGLNRAAAKANLERLLDYLKREMQKRGSKKS